ncbi:hypothetical protein JW968_04125 [Candidatus Woesearchaeota archaeon]|nr:hypothetical protein [Candidatus Woesearchaeota archaeon]
MGKEILALFGFLFLFLLLLSPWLTAERAEKRAVDAFEGRWKGVSDGCGVNCNGCGAIESRRFIFGYIVKIEYACGLLPADLPEYHKNQSVFVTALGTVHGIKRP